MSEEYDNVEEWRRRGEGFMVVVKRYPNGNGYSWSVGAYVYAAHPLFDRIDTAGSIFQDALTDAPLHCGCSLVRGWKSEAGVMTSKEFAADYQHLYDNHTHDRTKEDAAVQFRDARALFDWMAAVAKHAPVAADPA